MSTGIYFNKASEREEYSRKHGLVHTSVSVETAKRRSKRDLQFLTAQLQDKRIDLWITFQQGADVLGIRVDTFRALARQNKFHNHFTQEVATLSSIEAYRDTRKSVTR